MEKNNSVNVREIIAEILLSIDKGEEHSHILIKNVLDKYDYLQQNDKNFIKRVSEGTLENRLKIDYILNSYSKTPVNKMKPLIRNIMRMSVYQLLFMDKVPSSAVCNEAVKLAGKRGFKGLQGFVNGVLRNISRESDKIKLPVDDNSIESMSVLFSCPQIIVESLIGDYGVSVTKDCLRASLNEKSIYVRVDERLAGDEIAAIENEWDEAHIIYEKNDELPYAYKLKKADRLAKLGGFVEGKYTVQDLSSMMVCEMAGIKAGDIILDMCAAPGGKTTHAAVKLLVCERKQLKEEKEVDNDKLSFGIKRGIVYSRDVSDYKVGLIEENIRRLGLTNIRTEVFDATLLDENMLDKADVVIADVPCSGLGVIGRKPDIKYNLTKENLESIVKLQREIIDNAKKYVKSGGTLVYSTCTMRRAENDNNVKYLLEDGAFELVNEKQMFIDDSHDGFYIAKLKRR